MKIIFFLHLIRQNIHRYIDIWFFFAFLVALPLSIRKIFWYIPLHGQFNEYTDISIYLSDILLFLTLLSSLVIKYNKLISLSIYNMSCSTWNKLQQSTVSTYLIVTPALFIFWSTLSLLWSKNLPLGYFFILKLIELYGLYLFIIFRIVPRGTEYTRELANKGSTWNRVLQTFLILLISIGVLESILGILQFFYQHSLGITFIRESVLDQSMPGVAKIIFSNAHFIRSYGTFPHPNIFGGFLFTSILLSHLYFKLFHVEQSRQWIHRFTLLIQYFGIFLTFSKSALLGLLFSLIYIQLVSRGTLKNSVSSQIVSHVWHPTSLFHVKQYTFRYIASLILLLLLIFFFRQINIFTFFFQSLQERHIYTNLALTLIHTHPILGISGGQLVFFISQTPIYPPLLDWQLQPVHNVFLLIWAELGIVGFFLFTLFYTSLLFTPLTYKNNQLTNSSKERKLLSTLYQHSCLLTYYFRAILFGLLVILFFDHYLWDIQQGQLLFWCVLGVLSGLIVWNRSQIKIDIDK